MPKRQKGDKRVQATRFACAAPRFRTSTASGPACTGTRRSLVLAAGGSSAPGHTSRRRAAAERKAGGCGKFITRLPKAEHEAAEWQTAMEALIPGRDA